MKVGQVIHRGNNVKGGAALASEGPLDCARLCSEKPTCKAWTLNVKSNKCWLKTSNKNTGPSVGWVRGLPCWFVSA